MDRTRALALAALAALAAACTRGHAAASEVERSPRPGPAAVASALAAGSAPEPALPSPVASERASSPRPAPAARELSLSTGRAAYVAFGERRLIGHIHGVCGGPEYACARWLGAATATGSLVCPTGNVRCGDPKTGPASWEAASWGELVAIMDHDLEASVARAERERPGAIDRTGAVLTGYSRGGYAVPVLATAHPGRWPLLVIIEADAPLSAAALARAGVRKIALVAGEHSAERAGMKKSEAALSASRLPARLFVMKGSSHLYPDDMDALMRDVLAYVTDEADGGR
ncbi:MAG: hypothetical protein JNL38_14080 [Myxococcales bacterium]|nr:hypothetical protein [Myxococcales bacterium]